VRASARCVHLVLAAVLRRRETSEGRPLDRATVAHSIMGPGAAKVAQRGLAPASSGHGGERLLCRRVAKHTDDAVQEHSRASKLPRSVTRNAPRTNRIIKITESQSADLSRRHASYSLNR
jgi:hypothetical protein